MIDNRKRSQGSSGRRHPRENRLIQLNNARLAL